MLSYTTCCKLKAAGYEHDVFERGLYLREFCADPVKKGWSEWQYHPCWAAAFHDEYRKDAEYIACPNSDELIAAIQQRWPDYGIAQTTNMSWPLNPPRPARIDGYDAWVIGRDAKTWDDSIAEGTGNTPAAALAALYLALAGGSRDG